MPKPHSWKTSRAPDKLKVWHGKTVMAVGSEDKVIPSGVTALLKQSAPNLTFKEYTGASHGMGQWLAEHPLELSSLIAIFLQIDKT